MGSLREPGSAGEAVLVLLMALIGVLFGELLPHLLAPLPNPEQWVLVAAALIFVARPTAILIHELGHAAAVRRLGRRDARIEVGRAPWLHFRVGRVHVTFGVLPRSMPRMAGRCTYDPAGIDWRSRAWISLAGPLATFLQLAIVLAALPLVWSASGWMRNFLVFSEFGLILLFVLTVWPQASRSVGRAGVVPANDGWKAREAFRRYRAGAPAPELQPRPQSAPGSVLRPVISTWLAEDAQAVIYCAVQQARALGHAHVGSEHLLLGLLSNPQSMLAEALTELDVSFDAVRHEIQRLAGHAHVQPEKLVLTMSARRTLEYSLLEARKHGAPYVRTEELLLGLMTDSSGPAAQVLEKLGADREAIRGAASRPHTEVAD